MPLFLQYLKVLYIRAHQGHSIDSVQAGERCKPCKLASSKDTELLDEIPIDEAQSYLEFASCPAGVEGSLSWDVLLEVGEDPRRRTQDLLLGLHSGKREDNGSQPHPPGQYRLAERGPGLL